MARCIRAVGRWRWSVLVRGCGVQGCPWSGRGRHSGAPQVNDHQNPCVPAVRGLIAYLTLVLLYFLHLCARVRNVVSASFLLSLSLSSAPNPAAFRLANDRRIKETTGFYSCLTSVMKWQSRLPSAPRHRFMGLITASLCASTVIQDLLGAPLQRGLKNAPDTRNFSVDQPTLSIEFWLRGYLFEGGCVRIRQKIDFCVLFSMIDVSRMLLQILEPEFGNTEDTDVSEVCLYATKRNRRHCSVDFLAKKL